VGKNGKSSRKVGSMLVLLDCLSCDKCVSVFPNDANFSIPTPVETVAYEDVVVDGGGVRREAGGSWVVNKAEQWANLAEACNECGNCDVFCPEDGGPYVVKARWFARRDHFAESRLDGIHVSFADGLQIDARLQGARYQLTVKEKAVLSDGNIRAVYDPASGALLSAEGGPGRLSGAVFLTLKTLVRGVLDPARVNAISASLPGVTWPG
jgi:putative selenate reductase